MPKRAAVPTADEIMPTLRRKLREIEATLCADLPRGRLVLGALLAERRLRVYADGRIEGLATPAPEMLAAPRRTSEPRVSVVAGGCNARVSLPVPLLLPIAGRIETRAA